MGGGGVGVVGGGGVGVVVVDGAGCEITWLCCAIVTPPVRAAPVFATILNWTVPMPFPVAPAVTVIHGTWLTADHWQPVNVVTLTPLSPPSGPMPVVGGDKAYVQGAPP